MPKFAKYLKFEHFAFLPQLPLASPPGDLAELKLDCSITSQVKILKNATHQHIVQNDSCFLTFGWNSACMYDVFS
jgi:hypothetical protein